MAEANTNGDNRFEYQVTTEDTEETFTLRFKRLGRLPLGIVMDSRGDPAGGVWEMLEWGLSQEDLAILRRVAQDDLEPLMDAWAEGSAVTPGESGASRKSSGANRAARRSKPTLSASA